MDKSLRFIPDNMEAVDVTVSGNYVPVLFYCFSHMKRFSGFKGRNWREKFYFFFCTDALYLDLLLFYGFIFRKINGIAFKKTQTVQTGPCLTYVHLLTL